MALDKLRDLSERIKKETDQATMIRLIAEVTKLLQKEQEEIRARINRSVQGNLG